MAEWISVDDRLPDDTKCVLVWYRCEDLHGFAEGYGISWYQRSAGWCKADLYGENIGVMFWQPLPEPPEKGEENDDR